MSENRDIWKLWSAVKTQWRAGFDQLIGLDYMAIEKIAEMMDIEMNPCMLKKLDEIEFYMLSRQKNTKKVNS